MAKFLHSNILVLLTLAFSLFLNIHVLKVPVFADGTQHVWITEYVHENGNLPREDITGIQPSNMSVPFSIKNNQPMVYPPLFYILSGALSSVLGNSKASVEILNIVPMIVTSLFVFLLAKDIFGRKVALIAFILTSLSHVWPWFTVHRLVEPTIVMLVMAANYSLYKYLNGQSVYLLVLGFIFVTLFGIKQTVFPVLISLIVGILLKKNVKDLFVFSFMTFFLLVPIVLYLLNTTKSILPGPLGFSKFDSIFTNAWWNQEKMQWELELDELANTKELRELTINQFKQVQRSPTNLFQEMGIIGLLNNFSMYSISSVSTEGFQSVVPSTIYRFFWVLLLFFLLYSLYSKKRISLFLIYSITLFILVSIFWYMQPVFRYYIYIIFFSIFIYASSYRFLEIYFNNYITTFVLLSTIFFVVLNLGSEVDRNLDYQYTAMHRNLPKRDGGLSESINFAVKVKKENTPEVFIFTPMVEIAYYSKKRYLWDNRLFFVTDEDKLSQILGYYDFRYVVLPFYSGTTKLDNWRYSEGIPIDSTFNKILNNQKYFELVEKNNTFTAFRKVI